VGKLLQAVRPRAGEAALAIAAPYAAAVMQQLGLSVVLADASDTAAVGADQYDVIVCEGAVSNVPAAWTAALAPGGRLAVVVREGPIGSVRLYSRGPDGVGWRAVFDSTPPILPGFEAKAGFVF
jgi:protein-L-isoaspartate(D-aspartate) O-methyltransferase